MVIKAPTGIFVIFLFFVSVILDLVRDPRF